MSARWVGGEEEEPWWKSCYPDTVCAVVCNGFRVINHYSHKKEVSSANITHSPNG